MFSCGLVLNFCCLIISFIILFLDEDYQPLPCRQAAPHTTCQAFYFNLREWVKRQSNEEQMDDLKAVLVHEVVPQVFPLRLPRGRF